MQPGPVKAKPERAPLGNGQYACLVMMWAMLAFVVASFAVQIYNIEPPHPHHHQQEVLKRVVDRVAAQRPWASSVHYACGDVVEHEQTTLMCSRPFCLAKPSRRSADWSTDAFKFDIKYTVSYYLLYCLGMPMSSAYDQFFHGRAAANGVVDQPPV